MSKKILVVGAGFSGAVVAQQLAVYTDYKILVVDQRDHVGGNCHTERDALTGIMEHKYGPHIFNTDQPEVWAYVQKFGRFEPFVNRVKAVTERGVFSLPINLLTINQFFQETFNPNEAQEFLASLGDQGIIEPQNFEEQALKLMGKELYENFFKGYTLKQWGTHPQNLPAAILKRLPVRYNYDDNYYNTPFQGIPVEGYTTIVERMLDHPQIEVKLGVNYEQSWNQDFDYVFYTGPLDAYFNWNLGRLAYRSIYFEKEFAEGDYQGNAVINYCQAEVPYTRIHEHKHFTPWEKHARTFYVKEFSKETNLDDIPYYPKRLATDKHMLLAYRQLAEQEQKVFFLGRLATYRYMDMHHVIGEALSFCRKLLQFENWEHAPHFPNEET